MHWFHTMKPSGWVASEQVRGPEAETQVPLKFLVQKPFMGTPPSMVFPLKFLSQKAKAGETKAKALLEALGPRLDLFYNFLKNTQGNPTMDYTFSWRGKSPANENCFGSGLDDYPRGYLVNEEKEINVDLQTWMSVLSGFMVDLSMI